MDREGKKGRKMEQVGMSKERRIELKKLRKAQKKRWKKRKMERKTLKNVERNIKVEEDGKIFVTLVEKIKPKEKEREDQREEGGRKKEKKTNENMELGEETGSDHGDKSTLDMEVIECSEKHDGNALVDSVVTTLERLLNKYKPK